MKPFKKPEPSRHIRYICAVLDGGCHVDPGDVLALSARLAAAHPAVPPLEALGVDPGKATFDLFVPRWSGAVSEGQSVAHYRDAVLRVAIAANAPVEMIDAVALPTRMETPRQTHERLVAAALELGIRSSARPWSAIFGEIVEGGRYRGLNLEVRRAEPQHPPLGARAILLAGVAGSLLTAVGWVAWSWAW